MEGGVPLKIRRVRSADVPAVIELDARVTGLPKPEYWRDLFARYGKGRSGQRFFLVAEPKGGSIRGFIIGEVRAWEFGSAPCGWVFGLSVDPGARLQGIGEALFEAISGEFRQAGVNKMRTMVAREDLVPLQFFRGEGMMAGPYIQLEKDLE